MKYSHGYAGTALADDFCTQQKSSAYFSLDGFVEYLTAKVGLSADAVSVVEAMKGFSINK